MNLGTSPYPDPPQAADNDIPPLLVGRTGTRRRIKPLLCCLYRIIAPCSEVIDLLLPEF